MPRAGGNSGLRAAAASNPGSAAYPRRAAFNAGSSSCMDKALALEFYHGPSRNVEAERQACEIDCGRSGRLVSYCNRSNALIVADRPTLSDYGIPRDQSSRYQKLTDLPEDRFETALARPEEPTASAIIRGTEKLSSGVRGRAVMRPRGRRSNGKIFQ
jgi:hypothetical protein